MHQYRNCISRLKYGFVCLENVMLSSDITLRLRDGSSMRSRSLLAGCFSFTAYAEFTTHIKINQTGPIVLLGCQNHKLAFVLLQ